jgi:(E)-4-hydroxy-3-methyl-but-2-enyl pyrophosphate reductase
MNPPAGAAEAPGNPSDEIVRNVLEKLAVLLDSRRESIYRCLTPMEAKVAGLIRQRFPRSEVTVMNTVCLPTRLRQLSAEELACQADVVLVVGGAHSNNTRELVATCSRHCARVFHVQTASDVRAEWLAGALRIGITAGTSTPNDVIDDVEAVVRTLATGEVAA